jgi:hypothetical protein
MDLVHQAERTARLADRGHRAEEVRANAVVMIDTPGAIQ